MLVIDSEKTESADSRKQNQIYGKKTKEVLANGQETEGAKYQGKVLNRKKEVILRCA